MLVAPALAQCWQQHLEVGVTDPRIPSGLALAPGRLALGQPRIDPYANPLIVDFVRVFEGAPGSLVEVATLTSSLAHETSASFGTALDMAGDWLAVGDPAASDTVLGGRRRGAPVPALRGALGARHGVDHTDVQDHAAHELRQLPRRHRLAWSYRRVNGVWTEVHRFTTEAGVAWPVNMPVRVRALGGVVVLTDPEGATVFPSQPLASASIGCAPVPLPSTSPGIPGPPVYLDVRSELRLSLPALERAVFGGSSVGNGILFYGFAPASVPLGTGTRCAGGALARAAFGLSTPGVYLTPLVLPLQSPPVSSGALGIAPGVTTHFQYWFRTPSGSAHLSNSLELSFCP